MQLSVLAEANEFHEVRLRSGEKSLYKALNANNGIKFPIKVNIELAAHKRSIIIQAELGGVEYPADEQFANHRTQYQQDKGIIFTNIHRVIRCIADCQLDLQDAPGVRNALELGRSFAARLWDNSPLQMKQIPNIGPVAVRKLVTAGINSIEALEASEPQRINMILSKLPGFGEKILSILQGFPKLRVSIRNMSHVSLWLVPTHKANPVKDAKRGQFPVLKFKAELGFMNEAVPTSFNRKPIYVCFLAERSDGHLIDFRRIREVDLSHLRSLLTFSSARNFIRDELYLSTEILNESQYIICYVACDEIGMFIKSSVEDIADSTPAGTVQHAELRPRLPPSKFPPKLGNDPTIPIQNGPKVSGSLAGQSKCGNDFRSALDVLTEADESFDGDIGDADMVAAGMSSRLCHYISFTNLK